MTQRPVLAILKQFADMKRELSHAQQEIERRKQAEKALRQSQERLRVLATTDELTRLPNRRRFWETADIELKRATRYGSSFSLALLDIDMFKEVNDSKGHAAGDQVLRQLAQVCLQQLRTVDHLCPGGRGGVRPAAARDQPGHRLQGGRAPARRGGAGRVQHRPGPGAHHREHRGGHPAREGVKDAERLYNQADQALYRAKGQGRNHVSLAEPPKNAA